MKKPIFYLFPFVLASCAHQEKDHKFNLAANYYEEASLEVANNPKKALNLINKSIEYKVTPKSLLFKASLLYSIKEYQESVALFKKIFNDKRTPPAMRADAMNNCACALCEMNNRDEAISIWRTLTIDKDYLSPELAFYNIGLCYLQQAHTQPYQSPQQDIVLRKAENALLDALRVSKYFVDAMFYLSQIYIMQRKIAQAKDLLQQILIESPEHAVAQEILNKLQADEESSHNALHN